jgi:hypothetical protein
MARKVKRDLAVAVVWHAQITAQRVHVGQLLIRKRKLIEQNMISVKPAARAIRTTIPHWSRVALDVCDPLTGRESDGVGSHVVGVIMHSSCGTSGDCSTPCHDHRPS